MEQTHVQQASFIMMFLTAAPVSSTEIQDQLSTL
jgi:hypothetical protein